MARFGFTRREWLKHAAALGAAMAAPSFLAVRGARAESAGKDAVAAGAASPEAAAKVPSRVALTAGDNRVENLLAALKPFEKELAKAIGDRPVVIKPNNVSTAVPLAVTHADCLTAVCEFLKGIGKLQNAVIAESAATEPTLAGFEQLRYPAVARQYGVKLVDFDQEPFEVMHVIDERNLRPHPVRMAKRLMDPSVFIISACRPKIHNLAVVTLTLKNIAVGAPIKDAGYNGDEGAGPRSDKPIMHGGGPHGINYNLFLAAQRLHPHLAVLDGFEGMEGNGPVDGTAVDHRVAVVSTDWLAAERVMVELMGIDWKQVGYLNYCASAGMGEADLKKIEVVGDPIARHIKPYKMHRRIRNQLEWMNPLRS